MSIFPDSGFVSARLAEAREAIDRAMTGSGRKGSVRILAVTKTMPLDVLREALAAGVSCFGENRVSEGGRKIAALGRDAAEFHLIGPIHRSEARQAVRDFHSIDSVDRPEILRALLDRIGGKTLPELLLEIRTTPEESKHGFPCDPAVVAGILSSMPETYSLIRGLMTIGPLQGGETASRKAFSALREFRDALEKDTGRSLPELSMGMSDDFPWAVEEGATIVRLGRFLFGPRKT